MMKPDINTRKKKWMSSADHNFSKHYAKKTTVREKVMSNDPFC